MMTDNDKGRLHETLRMEKDHMTERILNLTLEIICLLTGESYLPVKFGDHVTIKVLPPRSLTPERNIEQKILEVTNEIAKLLTGEVPIRCQDVTVYFSMEEWEYLEGHKELYKDVMMASQLSLTSPDGSSNRNPPERFPCPLYSQDSPKEEDTIPHNDQGEELRNIKVEVKEEEEETLVSRDQPSMEEGEMIMETKQHEYSLYVDRNGHYVLNVGGSEEGRLPLASCCKAEDDHIDHNSIILDPITGFTYHRPYESSMDSSNPEESSDMSQTITPDVLLRSYRAERSTDLSNPIESSVSHDGDHTGESSLSSLECDDKTPQRRLRSHSGELPFSCTDCGKSLITKAGLLKHQKSHMSQYQFQCSECDKCFHKKGSLLQHQRIHTGERPFPCAECGKCFTTKGDLLKHQRNHTGTRPFSCTVCVKAFLNKKDLLRHERIHTGERPFKCLECEKCFSQKGSLVRHQRIHTGECPYLCTECGRCFIRKAELLKHQKSHNGGPPCDVPSAGNA